jgi:hypothetical protein
MPLAQDRVQRLDPLDAVGSADRRRAAHRRRSRSVLAIQGTACSCAIGGRSTS